MISKHIRVLSAGLGAALVVMALFASSAMARETAPGYGAFAGCPSPEENPEVFLCQRTVISSGNFKMGSKNVPITNPITLSAGVTLGGTFTANSKGGLTPVRQTVPGGVIGLTGLDWLVNFLNIEQLKLFAVTELAGQPHFGPESELILPIRVHLENPVLGNACYVGTFSNPIALKLTTGTTSPPPPNTPITGKVPTEEAGSLPGVFLYKNGTYVDNSFAAPEASGCVLTLFGFIPISLNGIVDSVSGLPAKAGTNETKQNFTSELVLSETVYP
jgi:hypothetical protein